MSQPTKTEPSWGEIYDLVSDLAEDGILVRLNGRGLLVRYCERFTDRGLPELVRMPVAELRALAASTGAENDATLSDDEYISVFLKDVLWLERLPKDELVTLVEEASRDLLQIAENLAECARRLADLEGKSGPEANYERRFYEHFDAMNREARDEIAHVLATEYAHLARTRSEKDWLPSLSVKWWRVPWSYQRFPRHFDPRKFSVLRHRVMSLPLSRFPAVEKLHASDEEGFLRWLREYCESTKPAEKLRELLGRHHLLHERIDILFPALDSYTAGAHALFCAAAVSQVEGIFEDCCRELGVLADGSATRGLVDKVERLKDSGQHIWNYEFFVFKFPVVRNRLAHGGLLDRATWEREARLLLLDLLYVADLLASVDHAGARLRALLSDGSASEPSDLVRFAALLEAGAPEPPDFYGLEDEWRSFRQGLETSADVWNVAGQLANDVEDESVLSALRQVVIRVKRDFQPSSVDAVTLLRRVQTKSAPDLERLDETLSDLAT